MLQNIPGGFAAKIGVRPMVVDMTTFICGGTDSLVG